MAKYEIDGINDIEDGSTRNAQGINDLQYAILEKLNMQVAGKFKVYTEKELIAHVNAKGITLKHGKYNNESVLRQTTYIMRGGANNNTALPQLIKGKIKHKVTNEPCYYVMPEGIKAWEILQGAITTIKAGAEILTKTK